ncbi:MAG: hypothetical protein DRN78_05670 [Thermoproteota archaeon]|nr:MAG: hypothetical protein DRN78_05670 [Candidatus Korarchaeota archaeon]
MSLYAVVDYNDKAKRLCVGGEYNLRIFYIRNGAVIKSDIYSISKIKSLIERKIPIIFRAKHDMPIECLKTPKRMILFGNIKW